MKKRPDAMWHMLLWGAIAGFVLAIIYFNALFFLVFYDSREFNYWSELLNLSWIDWVRTGFIGLAPGLVVGFLNGLFHRRMMRKTTISSSKFDMLQKRKRVYSSSFVLTTFLAMIVFLLFYFPYSLGIVILAIPFSIIAGFIGIFASYRYLRRFQRWSQNLDVRKSKAKNEETYRLTDKAKINEAITSETENLEQRSQQ